MLATLIVTNPFENPTTETVNGNGLTLREAIDYVNGLPIRPADNIPSQIVGVPGQPGITDTIVFAPGLTGTISLGLGSHLSITRPVTIQGPGSGVLTISAAGNDTNLNTHGNGRRIFDVSHSNNEPVTIAGLTLTGGDVGDVEGENEVVSGRGGAIRSSGRLVLNDIVATGNKAIWGGGVAIIGSNLPSIIENTTLAENEAVSGGGGIWVNPFSLNRGLLLDGVTITSNTSALGGGIGSELGGLIPTRLRNTIVAGNKDFGGSASNIEGDVSPFSSFNLLAVGGAGGLTAGVRDNIILTTNDPGLQPQSVNGGPTYYLPTATSPAADKGDVARRYSATEYDQHGPGSPRVLGGRIDIGAIERPGPIIQPPILATADVVFLVDQSNSTSSTSRGWYADVANTVETELARRGFSGNRYALTGFAREGVANSNRYGFTHLVDGQMFGSAEDFGRVAESLVLNGGYEDGWDAIEHAIAEYDFRDGAAVHFVLISDEMRGGGNTNEPGVAGLNTFLTQDDDVLTPDDERLLATAIAPLLAARDATLSVVADARFVTDNASADVVFGVAPAPGASHPLIEYDDQTNTTLPGFFNDNGTASDFNAVDPAVVNQYIRLAWQTGGSAWNFNVVENGISPSNPLMRVAAFSEAFAEGVASQIATQETYVPGLVVRAYDFGGPTSAEFPNASPSITGSSVVTAPSAPIYTASGSITVSAAAATAAFRTAIEASNLSNLSIPVTLPNGAYDVELFFSEIDSSDDRIFDVVIEGKTLLNNYKISADYSRVTPVGGSRLDSSAAEFRNGAVKVFRTVVTDGVLNINLNDAGGAQGPLLNALRVLDATEKGARVEDVVFIGRVNGVITELRMSERVAQGKQLNELDLIAVDNVRIEFDRPVEVEQGDLQVFALDGVTSPMLSGFFRDPTGVSATWGFASNLSSALFGMRMNSATVLAEGLALDGEWHNPLNRDQFSGPSGSPATDLLSGNGVAGGNFFFVFTVIPGDFNGDYRIDHGDLDLLLGNWGALTFAVDADGNGMVDNGELDALLGGWGYVWSSLGDLLLAVDFNGDGSVNQDDRLGSTGFNQRFATQQASADLNNDGLWNALDQAFFDYFADVLTG